VIALGAGGVSRQILGTTVVGGMLFASFIAIFLIPVCFHLMESLVKARPAAEPSDEPTEPAATTEP
jgi:HAE1 family hydrophobic/amphiphilic exporter-1